MNGTAYAFRRATAISEIAAKTGIDVGAVRHRNPDVMYLLQLETLAEKLKPCEQERSVDEVMTVIENAPGVGVKTFAKIREELENTYGD